MTGLPDDALAQGPVWLDLTRTLSRAGRGVPTGIDRVELAWLDRLASTGGGLQCLCRTTRGFLLLPPEGGKALSEVLLGISEPGEADLWSRITGRGGRARHRAEALIRRHAIDRCSPWGLSAMVRRHAPRTYCNVGHANLAARVYSALDTDGCRIVTVLHDLIPLTHPDLVPTDQPEAFARKLGTVAAHAALVVAVSEDTRRRLSDHWGPLSRKPVVIAAPIGVPELPDLPSPPPRETGRFVMVGTLEPRKNHGTILRAWSLLAEDAGEVPQLHIVGNPGWKGDAIRREIEGHPLFGRSIFLHTGTPDAALADQLARAGALLYPTLAEGFGLPPWEALALGARPICADLPVLRAYLGPHAVYVDPTDVYSWAATIRQYMSGSIAGPSGTPPEAPGWQEHFERVSAALSALRDRAERP
ncbi:glycosyltransferase [Roseibacterium sp. SDUM158016]|uniref:glycosyltransferase n=1 Tax=Roseicyclus sediminis TaxID=2980997 RepID=UPI0021CF6F38|nr:glycosyltransferase [Roseibacterium sp. SDUM158016]MCU4652265.1 glycosyltransferase [Roseibacterium sp. SDUM158016]